MVACLHFFNALLDCGPRIVVLSIGEKKVIHAATFIAADILFTKNGHDFTQPWLLMPKQDMLDTYAARYPSSAIKTLYFRKRSI